MAGKRCNFKDVRWMTVVKTSDLSKYGLLQINEERNNNNADDKR